MASLQELQRAGRAFASGDISQSQLEQVSSGKKTLNEIQEPQSKQTSNNRSNKNKNNTDQQQGGSENTPSTANIQRATRAFIVDGSITESQLKSIKAGQTTLEQARQSDKNKTNSSKPTIKELGNAGRAFLDDEITQSQLDRIEVGETTLEQARQSDKNKTNNALGAGSPKLAEASTAFTGNEISIDQLRQIQRGETTLEQARQSDKNKTNSSKPSIQELGEAGKSFASGEITQSELDQIESGETTLSEIQEPQPEPQPEQTRNNSNSNQNTNNTEQQQGIDAPSIQELGQAGREFASSGGDVSQDDLENLETRFKADVNNDGTINDQDAQALADQGQFETAQTLEDEIDQVLGTENDGTPDSLKPPTVSDVIGENRQVDSAAEADALAEAARQSDEISEKQARKLLDQAADQGSLRSQNNILNRDSKFSDQSGGVAFSRFEIKAPGGSTNPSLRERTNVNDQLIIDRRGSRGRIESISINGEEVQVTPSGNPRAVGPITESGGDEKRDRLVVDIPEGVDPGIADISIQESFGPQDNPDDRFFFGTETTQAQVLLTEQAPIVDNQAFEETFQGTQTQDRITNPDVISGSEAQSLLGEDTVQDLGGQQEAAAEVSRIINQTPEEREQSQQSARNTRQQSQQEKEQSQQSNPIVEEGSLADTVGSVTRDREDPTFNDESATVGRAIDDAVAKANRNLSGRREAAADNAQQERANKQGETRASVNRVGQQQLNAQTQKETETFGDISIQNPLTGNRLEDDLGDVAQEFQDSSETVFANLGRVQPTPVTIGTGGTRTADETTSGIRGAGLDGFISGINPAEIALDSKEIAEFVIKRGDEAGEIVLKPTADLLAGNQVDTTTELQDDLNTEASAIEEQARKNPAQTTASVIGGVAGGVAGGFAAARGARGAIRGARSLDLDSSDIADAVSSAQQRSTGSSSSITGGDIDAINDIFDKRIRFDGGRDRKQKQIEKTEEIERDIIDQDQLDELEQRQGLDDSISDIEQTARRRLPPQRQFETEGEFRRELERAMRQEEKQRLKSQSESDSNTQRGTNTDTDTRTRTTELTSAAVGGIAGGFGQISVETEPQVPNNQNDDTDSDTNDTAAVIGGSGGGFGQPEFEPVIQPDLNLGFGFGSVGQPEAAAGAGQSESESLFGDDDTDAGFVVQLPETPLIGGIDEEITQEIGDQDQISFPIEDIGEQTETQIETGIQEEITTPEIQQGQETDLQREQEIQRQQEIELETQLELNQKKRKKELEIPPFGQPQETEIQPSETFAGVRNVESTLTQRELDIQ